MNTKQFETRLRKEYYAENSILAYRYALKEFRNRFRELNRQTLLLYKTYLIDSFQPKTVNLRIQAINKYLDCCGKGSLKLRTVRIPESSFLENAISNEDYVFLTNRLKEEADPKWYFAVRYIAVTGARISELVQLKVEHVRAGFFDIYSKGGKVRRLYIPALLRKETLEWLERDSGYLFVNPPRRPPQPREPLNHPHLPPKERPGTAVTHRPHRGLVGGLRDYTKSSSVMT